MAGYCKRCQTQLSGDSDTCIKCEISSARSAANSSFPVKMATSVYTLLLLMLGIVSYTLLKSSPSKPSTSIPFTQKQIIEETQPVAQIQFPAEQVNSAHEPEVVLVVPQPTPRAVEDLSRVSSPPSSTSAETPNLESVIQDFLDSGVFTKASIDGGIARVKIPSEFRTMSEETQEACLDALWDYYYEDKSPSAKLIIQDSTSLAGVGYYSQKDGLFWNPDKSNKETVSKPKRIADKSSRVLPTQRMQVPLASSTFGSKSKYISSSGKTQRVSGYVTKSGKVVSSYMRRPRSR